MKSHNQFRLCALLLACLILSGCAAHPMSSAVSPTLPPVVSRWEAPEDDLAMEYSQTVMLYLPSHDGMYLTEIPATVQLSAGKHYAETLCDLLLSASGTDTTMPLGGEVLLSLAEMNPIELSGNVVTVNLSASALRLSKEQLFIVGQALANTLCQFDDLKYVNVLISDIQPGIDRAETLPVGCFQRNVEDELTTLWARVVASNSASRRALIAPLYYPAPAGKGILCEARMLSFLDVTFESMAETLLMALFDGPKSLTNVPKCPDLISYTTKPVEFKEKDGKRTLVLYFDKSLNDALIDAGVTRSVMLSSLVYTLTTFLPGLVGIEMQIGEDWIQTISPSGTYTKAGETIQFPDGVMQRKHFDGFLLTKCALYFPGKEGKLTNVYRPVPFSEASSPRYLIRQLLLGPQSIDGRSGLAAAFPKGMKDTDILGIAFHEGTLILNLSEHFADLCRDMSDSSEKQMVYAMVNTLTGLPMVNKVSFFIAGHQIESFGGAVYLSGDFMPNIGIVE